MARFGRNLLLRADYREFICIVRNYDTGFTIDANLPDLQEAGTFLIGFYARPYYPLFANCVVNLA